LLPLSKLDSLLLLPLKLPLQQPPLPPTWKYGAANPP
jgi:hypothetical protein